MTTPLYNIFSAMVLSDGALLAVRPQIGVRLDAITLQLANTEPAYTIASAPMQHSWLLHNNPINTQNGQRSLECLSL